MAMTGMMKAILAQVVNAIGKNVQSMLLSVASAGGSEHKTTQGNDTTTTQQINT